MERSTETLEGEGPGLQVVLMGSGQPRSLQIIPSPSSALSPTQRVELGKSLGGEVEEDPLPVTLLIVIVTTQILPLLLTSGQD